MVSFAVALAGLALAVGSMGRRVAPRTRCRPRWRAPRDRGSTWSPSATSPIAGGPYARDRGSSTRALDPERVLLAGDIAYPSGSLAELAELLRPGRGAGSARVWLPVPGNHEYRTAGAAGYREFFDETGGLYWSKKVGSWRVIGLDSEKVAERQAAQVAQGHAEEAQREADPGHVAPPALLPRRALRPGRHGRALQPGAPRQGREAARLGPRPRLRADEHPCGRPRAPPEGLRRGHGRSRAALAARPTTAGRGASSSTTPTTACSTSGWPTAGSAGPS